MDKNKQEEFRRFSDEVSNTMQPVTTEEPQSMPLSESQNTGLQNNDDSGERDKNIARRLSDHIRENVEFAEDGLLL
ncbi:uncharacterized protein VTP21DRAFT_4593 [Calcarisporiella thermophila]|uniref:uncharacterized protein n=1 Tax=Calcarisporiella thermophila TaxID=911321 RepID=UPI00374217DC